ncbi:MAG: DUF4230 domain-containing protein [Lachnospiraceae bacterium]|nr:DUF4230 domain-containing protein [Lachnospiraceae bacterium]
MENEKKTSPLKFFKWIVILIVVVFIIGGGVYIAKNGLGSFIDIGKGEDLKDAIVGEEGSVTTITEASLEEVFEISELSTVDFFYNAIARQYEDDDETTVDYYVAYEGTVTAGIDFEKIDISIDEENKIIVLTLPDSEIQNTSVDFGSMEYIFADSSSETETVSQEAYELCQKDLKERAKSETQLLDMAEDNAESVVQALVDPWVNQIDSEYTVVIE